MTEVSLDNSWFLHEDMVAIFVCSTQELSFYLFWHGEEKNADNRGLKSKNRKLLPKQGL